MVIFIFMYNSFYESKRDFYNSTCPFLFPPYPVLSQYIPFYEVRRNKKNKTKTKKNNYATRTLLIRNSAPHTFRNAPRRRQASLSFRQRASPRCVKIRTIYLQCKLCMEIYGFGSDSFPRYNMTSGFTGTDTWTDTRTSVFVDVLCEARRT